MDHIHYEDIAALQEDDLDCLSIEALFAEMLIEDDTGLAPCWGDE
jgi:hypothetical protein